MNNNLESILSYYYYGPTDVWADFVGAVEEWARNERADAWDEGAEAGWNEAEDCCAIDGMVGDFHKHSAAPNPHRK